MQPGLYVLVPCTFQPDRVRSFVLRVYTPPRPGGGRAPIATLSALPGTPVMEPGSGVAPHTAVEVDGEGGGGARAVQLQAPFRGAAREPLLGGAQASASA